MLGEVNKYDAAHLSRSFRKSQVTCRVGSTFSADAAPKAAAGLRVCLQKYPCSILLCVYAYESHLEFHSSTLRHAVSSFRMPAMSPTMSEGGIASWKINEGDTFTAGDVLLEIVWLFITLVVHFLIPQ